MWTPDPIPCGILECPHPHRNSQKEVGERRSGVTELLPDPWPAPTKGKTVKRHNNSNKMFNAKNDGVGRHVPDLDLKVD